MTALPVTLACDLADGAEAPWLIEGLWADRAVGVLGGEPKCCKSFLALDVAVSVASGRPCLRAFPVRRTGPVLLFPAEDPHAVVRRRLEGIAAASGTELAGLPVHVITAPRLMLDRPGDRRGLAETVKAVRPVLLVLDPFIRLHRVDENAASEVAPILGYLREIQRRFEVAVMLVHHARKDSRGARPGQALRGSSDLHGWGDSNLYIRRTASGLRLSVEHRAAPARENLPLDLCEYERGVALLLLDGAPAPDPARAKPDAAERILDALAKDPRPVCARELRRRCAMRSSTLCATLPALVADGHVERTAEGLYRLPPGGEPQAVSASRP